MGLITRRATRKAAPLDVRLLVVVLSAVAVLSACASPRTDIDVARFAKMSCPELDDAISTRAKSITQLAVRRGETADLTIPNWLLGVPETVAVVNERRTARIEDLKSQQAAIIAVRARQCPA